jgi:quercetin dioxygenase-like cupin family protein
MQRTLSGPMGIRLLSIVAVSAAIGIVLGALGSRGLAETTVPSEHKGLKVEALGVIPEQSMEKQIGLTGHKLQLRAITIEPGGQIAKHSHESRPGLVKVISGTWTEGRPGGETEFAASQPVGILEDSETVHWFWNRGSEPATAIVCDIVAAD